MNTVSSIRLFDSHCHLDDPCYDNDLEAVLQRAQDVGVQGIMIAGIDRSTSEKALQIAASHPTVFCAVGFHPHDAKSCSEAGIEALTALAAHPKVKAWGEIGLDYNRMFSTKADQQRWLVRQLEAADALALPVIFHERESGGKLIEILKQHHRRLGDGVIHCFSGTRSELEAYLEMGYAIGITGIVTIQERGKALRELLRAIPVDRLLIETDAPYLTPAPEKNRHRRNEPAFVRSVLQTVASVLEQPLSELAETIWRNTCRLYRIESQMVRSERVG